MALEEIVQILPQEQPTPDGTTREVVVVRFTRSDAPGIQSVTLDRAEWDPDRVEELVVANVSGLEG